MHKYKRAQYQMRNNRKKMRWPNLFIIGAPKCGTTSLSHYLARHPQIFMSEQAGMKEPQFFNIDHDISTVLWAKGDAIAKYMSLFENSMTSHVYLGEASTWYLYSEVAVKRILEVQPGPRFIIMVRNPLHMALSLFNQFFKEGYEDQTQFATAWILQQRRLNGAIDLPLPWQDGKRLQYGAVCKTGEQIARLYEIISRDKAHVVVFDDLVRDPRRTYLKTLDFLGLKDDSNLDFPVLNRKVTFRSPRLHRLLLRVSDVRESLGIPGGLGVHKLINKINRVNRPLRICLPKGLREEMVNYFRADVALLSSLLERDLTHWLED
jgi:hypothetical protein